MDRRLFPVKEARIQLGGIGQNTFYKLVESGHIKLTKMGSRSFVTGADLDACVVRLQMESPEGKARQRKEAAIEAEAEANAA